MTDISIGYEILADACNADEFWNVTACATCSTGQFSLGGAATTTSCTSP